jgi:hypothetical protein
MRTFGKIGAVVGFWPGAVRERRPARRGQLARQRRHALDLFGKGDADEPRARERRGRAVLAAGLGQGSRVPVGVPNTFADLAEGSSAGVVNISAEKTMSAHPLEEWFGMPNFPFQMPDQPQRRASASSSCRASAPAS